MPEEPPDPCSSGEYLKNKLKSMPLLGNKSINDLLPPGGLGGVIAPELPKPPGLPGPGTFPTGGEIMGGIKDGIKDKLSDLHPDKIIAGVKAGAKDRLKTRLTDALNEKVSDILGPVKDGIGNRILHQVKGNLLMGALDEVANIAIGAPNVFDPCGKKAKEKTADKVAKAVDIGKSAAVNNDMNKAIGSALKLPKNSTNAMKKMLQSPVDIPTGALPPFKAMTNPADTLKAKGKQTEALAQVTNDATEIVAKKTEEKVAKEGIAEAAAPIDPFPKVTASGDTLYRSYTNKVVSVRKAWSQTNTSDRLEHLKKFKDAALQNAMSGKTDPTGTQGNMGNPVGLLWQTNVTTKIVRRYAKPGESLPEEYYVGWGTLNLIEYAINIVTGSVFSTNKKVDTVTIPYQAYIDKGLDLDIVHNPLFGNYERFTIINDNNQWGHNDNQQYVYLSQEDCATAIIDVIFSDDILSMFV